MSSQIVQVRPNFFGSGTVRVALLGYLLGGAAFLLSFSVFTDDTQTNTVIWLRVGALGLGVASAGFFAATAVNRQREQRLLRLIDEERRAAERAEVPHANVDQERLLAALEDLHRRSASFKYEFDIMENRASELVERLRAVEEENDALRSLLGQKRASDDG